jgi:hypothetical protein
MSWIERNGIPWASIADEAQVLNVGHAGKTGDEVQQTMRQSGIDFDDEDADEVASRLE